MNIRNNLIFFFFTVYKMIKLTEHELRLIAKNRGINNYINISREKLLSSFDKLEHITENLSKYGLNTIIKI